MEKLDLNMIHNRIDQMSLNSWKIYQNKAEKTEQEAEKKTTDTFETSERDKRLNSQLNSAKEDINLNSTGYTGTNSIEKELTALRDKAVKAQSGKLDTASMNNLSTTTTDALANIDKTSGTKYKDNAVLEKYSTQNLGLEKLDLTSKDAIAKIDKALEKVKSGENNFEANMKKGSDKVDELKAKESQYSKADELINSVKNQITSNPASAITAQSGGLNAGSIYNLINAL